MDFTLWMLSLSILLFGNIAFPIWKMNTATANAIVVMLYHNTFCMIRRYLCREKKGLLAVLEIPEWNCATFFMKFSLMRVSTSSIDSLTSCIDSWSRFSTWWSYSKTLKSIACISFWRWSSFFRVTFDISFQRLNSFVQDLDERVVEFMVVPV